MENNTAFDKALENEADNRINEARRRIAERKEVLAELAPTQAANSSVLGRLKAIENRPAEQEEPSKKTEKRKPGNMAGLAKDFDNLEEKKKAAGLTAPTPAQRDNDKKSKEQEKTKEHKREEAQKQQEEKMKKYDNILLPGGLIIKEVAGKWMLYNKDGKSVDITSTMETIRQQNGRINEANEQIDKQNELAGTPRVPTADKAISNNDKVDMVSTVLSNDDVKKEVFGDLAPEMSPEAIRDMAQAGIELAEDTRLLDMLKDPNQADKALKEIEDKDKQNKNRNQKGMSIPINTHSRGGIE